MHPSKNGGITFGTQEESDARLAELDKKFRIDCVTAGGTITARLAGMTMSVQE